MSAARRRLSVKQRLRRDALAGVGMLAVVAVIVFLVFGGWGVLFGGYRLDAHVPSSLGLRAGSLVRIAGVDVGKVTEVRRGPGELAEIRMELREAALPLHEDASIKVRPRLFLEGNFVVEVRPGSPSAPELRSGSTIPPARTALPVQFDQFLGILRRETRDDLKRTLKSSARVLRRGGAEALNRSWRPAAPALRDTAITAEAVRGARPDDLSVSARETGRVLAALATRRAALAELLERLDRTAGTLARRRRELSGTVSGLSSSLRAAYPALGALRAALPESRRFARELRPALRRLPPTLDRTVPVLRELDGLTDPDELPRFLRSAAPALRAIGAYERPLTGLLGDLAPVGRCLRDTAVPTLTASVEDDHLTTGNPVWFELAQTAVGLASASQSFDGNGPWVRYLVSGGEQLLSLGRLSDAAAPLLMTGDTPLLGSRPPQPAARPPFRTDVACDTQGPPDLRAGTTPPPVGGR